MKEIIIKFIYSDIEYIIYKENDKYIPCKKVNDNISFDLTNEELSIVNNVFNKVKTTDNQIKLSNIKFDNKEYQHFYDKTNEWNIFLNIDGTNIKEEELSLLNNLYNYQDDKMYMAYNMENQKFIKRLVNLGKTTIATLVLSTSLISPLSNLTTVQGKEIKTEAVEVQEEKEELSAYQKIENLKNSINNNENLSKEEKKFILDAYNDILYDKIDLIDYDLVNKRFEDLYIEYENEECKDGNLAGYYMPSTNFIHMYSSTGIEDTNKITLQHELFHVLQEKGHIHSGLFEPINDILVEEYHGVNEYEYYREYSWGYDEIKPYIYELCELCGSDVLDEYNFKDNISLLKSKLMNLINDEEKYYELITNLDIIPKIIINKNGEYSDRVSMLSYIYDNLNNILGEYVEAKTGKSRYSDLSYIINLYPNEFETLVKSENIKYVKKPGRIYFNSNFKDNDYGDIYIEREIQNDNNLNYLETLDYLKNKNMIDADDYKNLKKEYKLYLNKKISFDDLNEYLWDHDCGFYIDNEENMKIVFFELFEEQKIDSSFLDGKEEKMEECIDTNNKLLNKKVNYSEIFNLKGYELKSNGITLELSINNKTYSINSKYSKEIVKYLNKMIINNNYHNINFSLNGNILSIYNNEKVYNINIKNGKKVSLKKLIKKANVSKEEIIEQVILDYKLMAQEYGLETKTDEIIDSIVEKNVNNFIKNDISNGYLNDEGKIEFNIKFKDLYEGSPFSRSEKIIIGTPHVYEKVEVFG